MYQWALQGREKALGPEHTSTLSTVNNLGILYSKQGKLAEAEGLFTRALEGYQHAEGDHEAVIEHLQEQLEALRIDGQMPDPYLESESQKRPDKHLANRVKQSDRTARMRNFALRMLEKPWPATGDVT